MAPHLRRSLLPLRLALLLRLAAPRRRLAQHALSPVGCLLLNPGLPQVLRLRHLLLRVVSFQLGQRLLRRRRRLLVQLVRAPARAQICRPSQYRRCGQGSAKQQSGQPSSAAQGYLDFSFLQPAGCQTHAPGLTRFSRAPELRMAELQASYRLKPEQAPSSEWHGSRHAPPRLGSTRVPPGRHPIGLGFRLLRMLRTAHSRLPGRRAAQRAACR